MCFKKGLSNSSWTWVKGDYYLFDHSWVALLTFEIIYFKTVQINVCVNNLCYQIFLSEMSTGLFTSSNHIKVITKRLGHFCSLHNYVYYAIKQIVKCHNTKIETKDPIFILVLYFAWFLTNLWFAGAILMFLCLHGHPCMHYVQLICSQVAACMVIEREFF